MMEGDFYYPPIIETIAEHNVDVSLLPDHAVILDLGCLNFIFCNEMRRRGHIVYPVDIQDIPDMDTLYSRVAITDYDGYGYVIHSNDKQATMFSQFDQKNVRSERIKCRTLKSFMKDLQIEMFDLIKMDVESSEWQIIMSLDSPPAKQLSIEFHMHTGAYGDEDVYQMVSHLRRLGYEIASHQKTSQHGLPPNYWSSLFILRS